MFFNPLGGMSFDELSTYHKQQLEAIRRLLTNEEMQMPIEELSDYKRNWFMTYHARAEMAIAEMDKLNGIN